MSAADPSEKPMLEHALEYLSLGYPIFPVCSPLMGAHQHFIDGRLRDCVGDKVGKNPMRSWKLCQTELPTAAQVRSWWQRWPTANIGMATGSFVDVIVLDCDNGDARQAALEKGGLEKAPAVWTGTPGGIHFWMKHPGYPVKNFVKDIPGTDFRGDGGYVLLPPSRHHKGATYRWNEHTLGMSPPPVPDWLGQLFQDKAAGVSGDGTAKEPLDLTAILNGIGAGERDTTLYRYACKMRGDDVPQAYAEQMVRQAARLCKPAFDEDEAASKVTHAYHDFKPNEDWSSLIEDDEEVVEARAAEDAAPRTFSRPISELMAMPDEEPEWMVNPLFTVASNGWIGAEPKVGKSWAGLELVYCLSTGSPFLGRFAVPQRRKVLYIQEEDSSRRVRRRLGQIIRGDATRSVPSDEYLRYVIREGFRIDSPVWIELLRRDVIDFLPDVIVLDVFNRLHGQNENDQKEMTEILRILTSFTNEYGCAFIVVHHDRKPQQGNEARGNQRLRGSGVLGGWGECSLYLRRAKEKDTIIVTPESKDSPELDDFQFTIMDQPNGGVVLQVGDVESDARLSKGDQEVMDAVERITMRGIAATAKSVGDELGKDRSTVQARLKRLAKAGDLDAVPISDEPLATIIYTVVSR